jgi:hypothetical protein
MKATFKVTERGEPAIVLTPESPEETVLCTVFSTRCMADGFRIAGTDHQARGGAVDEITLFPAPVGDTSPPKGQPKK